MPVNAALSQKTRIFSRGSFSTGTSGFGFIQMKPSAFSDIVNGNSVSTATTAMNSSTTISGATNTTSVAAPNSPFSSGQVGTGATSMSYRIVGAAIYVKYAGTALNKGGDMVLLEQPAHADTNILSYSTALGFDGAKRVAVKDEWQHLCWVPVTSSDVDFSTSVAGLSINPLAIFVNSAGTPQPFDYEIYTWVEFCGSLARAPSLSWNDPIGYQAVFGASQSFQQLDSELGLPGFVQAVEAQLNNQSLPRTEPPHANFVGLLSFLPQLASLAGPYIKAAVGGAVKGVSKQMGENGNDRGARVLKDLGKLATGNKARPKAIEKKKAKKASKKK